MNLMDATLLGIVEGLTEFLPVSSTGHMIVASQFLGVEQNDANKAFEVIIQLAAILAVAVRYREKITWAQRGLWMRVLTAFLPAATVGFLFHDQVKSLFSLEIVAVMFIVGGIIFLVLERFYRADRAHTGRVEEITFRQAAWIGVAQVFSMIPGTSRAGATIVGALLVGVDRKTAAEFSFLLALPIMAAASGLDFLKNFDAMTNPAMLPALAAGFVAAFVTALLAIRLFVAFLSRHTFVPFGIYRILFGAALLAWVW